ncbi:MAG: hypothetical protein Q8P89_02180 [bacterium]|nr:hypothetical protein [bacterium]
MEPAPIVLSSAVGILTVVLALVGIQVVRILQEVRGSVQRFNKILGDVGKVTEGATSPTSSFSGMFFGAKMGLKILKTLLARHKKGEK